MSAKIRVDLADRSYDVRIAPDAMEHLGQAVVSLDPSSVVVVTDSTVQALHAQKAQTSLENAGIQASLLTFPAGEEHKNLETFSSLADEILALKPAIDRKTLLVGLGGGVVGDMCGFLAAVVLRGLRVVQCPTTLLSAVDASVGGKTGLDHQAGKNLIGAFHQPAAVLIDVGLLKTLDDRQLSSGLAECVKHGIIRDETLVEYIESNYEQVFDRRSDVLCDLVARNVQIKAQVVSADERESGQREHLNFGHTIGHAIEALGGYGAMLHGEAVSLGMVLAMKLARERELIDADSCKRITTLLEKLRLPVSYSELAPEEIWVTMLHDKKARHGKVRMILPTAIGRVESFDDITLQELAKCL